MAAGKDQILVRTRLAEGMKLILCTSHLEVLFLEDSMAEIHLTADKDMEVTGNIFLCYIYVFGYAFGVL